MDLKVKIRIILWLLLSLFTAWILYMGLVPSGNISYSYNFDKENSFISKLSPNIRVGDIEGGSQKIIADPLYFSLQTPRKFNKAKLGIYYKSDDTARPIIETGVMVDKTIWRYDLKPVQNKIIDELCNSWNKIEEDGLLFCQKENNFSSVDEFLTSTTSADKIALYNYKLDRDFILSDYATSTDERIIDIALRGGYQFYTYIKKETMDFEFSFVDINNNKDADRIDLNLYYNDLLIDTRHLDDDGNSNDDKRESELRTMNLRIPNLPEGVYKIEIRVNDDIVTKQIKSQQKVISFINKINIAEDGASDINLYTDSQRLEATTIYPDNLQTITIGNTELIVSETYKQFSCVLEASIATSGLQQIMLEKDGLTISGNGMFSFFEDALVNPKFKKVDENLDLTNTSVEYILADYKSPENIDGWNYSEIDIDLSKAYREDRTYSFIISIPGLKIDVLNDFIEIDKIEIDLEGDPLFDLLKEKIN